MALGLIAIVLLAVGITLAFLVTDQRKEGSRGDPVAGEARDVVLQPETDRMVLRLKVVRQDAAPVDVEMRSHRIRGRPYEGDSVQVFGFLKSGVLIAARIHDDTTKADIVASPRPKWQTTVGWLALVLVIGALASMILIFGVLLYAKVIAAAAIVAIVVLVVVRMVRG